MIIHHSPMVYFIVTCYAKVMWVMYSLAINHPETRTPSGTPASPPHTHTKDRHQDEFQQILYGCSRLLCSYYVGWFSKFPLQNIIHGLIKLEYLTIFLISFGIAFQKCGPLNSMAFLLQVFLQLGILTLNEQVLCDTLVPASLKGWKKLESPVGHSACTVLWHRLPKSTFLRHTRVISPNSSCISLMLLYLLAKSKVLHATFCTNCNLFRVSTLADM